MTYQEFLKKKELQTITAGFKVDPETLNPNLFDFQRDIVAWALQKGRAAILIGCGNGKTIIQLEWANQIVKRTGGKALIFAPLSVVHQTANEAVKFDIGTVNICRKQEDVNDGINITNYEMMEHFDMSAFEAVVLDESSILKSYTSQTQGWMVENCACVPYRLLCTATIAPNNYAEIATSCEFLGIMSRTEMLATYFVHDSGKTSEWRLKGWGQNKFWEWMATWAIYFDNPKELGYDVDGYDLPPLNIHKIITKSEPKEYEMFAQVAETLEERRLARKESIEDRTDTASSLANESDDIWLMWVDYNDESAVLHKKTNDSVEVKGSDSPEYKSQASIDFADGKIHALVSKSSIFGFGSNFQSCSHMIFCGLSDSFERYYQAIRRCWRFGQEKPVEVYIILSERELAILENIQKKQKQMDVMQKQMTSLMRDVTLSEIKHTTRITEEYKPRERMELPKWIA